MGESQESHGQQATAPGAPASAPVASEPSFNAQTTALPTNPATHPKEAKAVARDTHPSVVAREVEKTKAERMEIKGEKQQGTVVAGLEDDRLWAMLRRFDVVGRSGSRCVLTGTANHARPTPRH